MSDLRKKLIDMRAGMNLLGLSGDTVNWQSIAVLMSNSTQPGWEDTVWKELLNLRGGWSTQGVRKGISGTSLYLSPKGMAYWLSYGGHERLYWFVMGCSQDKLDNAGWLHISGGRVDVRCRISPAQQRWLDSHKPHPDSEYSAYGGWNIKGASDDAFERRPQAYDTALPFDVRPVDEIDTDEGWERLMLRISQAKHRTEGTE